MLIITLNFIEAATTPPYHTLIGYESKPPPDRKLESYQTHYSGDFWNANMQVIYLITKVFLDFQIYSNHAQKKYNILRVFHLHRTQNADSFNAKM